MKPKDCLFLQADLSILVFSQSLSLTQDNVADKINMDTPNLSNIENGKRFMSPENIEKIAKALNVEVKDLFNYEHLQPQDTIIATIQAFLNTANPNLCIYVYSRGY